MSQQSLDSEFEPTDDQVSQGLIVLGSINIDLVVTGKALPKPGETVTGGSFFKANGGKGANQAVAAARMGGDVTMIGRLGNDVFADQSIKRLIVLLMKLKMNL